MAVITKQELEDAAVDAQTLEDVANGDATATITSRLGSNVKSVAKAINDLGYEVPVAFGTGLSVTVPNYTVSYLGRIYAPVAAELPFTTTATFNPNQWLLVNVETESVLFENQRYEVPGHPGQLSLSERDVFGFTALSPTTGRIFIFSRKGTLSETSEGSVHMIYSDDNGVTWSSQTELWVEAGVNHTNLAGGCASNGNVIVFYVRYSSPWPTFLSINYRVSTDNGATWGAEQTLISGTGAYDAYSPYGKAELLPNGDMLLCWYNQSPSYQVHVIKSTDNGLNWTALSDLPTISVVTETDILALDANNIVTVSRRDGQPKYRMCTSDDAGATWTDRGDIDAFTFTNVSPCWLEKFTDPFGESVVALYYYQRGPAAGSQVMNVIYAYAQDIIDSGPDAFKARSSRVLWSDGNGTGYPSAVHPNDDIVGIGWVINEDDIRIFHSLEGTAYGAHWQGRKLGLGGEPDGHDFFVRGNAAIGEDTAGNTAPINGALVQGDLGVGFDDSVGSFPARIAVKSTGPQLRLYYNDTEYVTLKTNNLGYMTFDPGGSQNRFVFGTSSAPNRTFTVFDGTAPTFAITNTSEGMAGGLLLQFISGQAYIQNQNGGPINLSNLLKLTATGTVPSPAFAGYVYLDDGTNTGDTNPHFRYYDGSAWNDL